MFFKKIYPLWFIIMLISAGIAVQYLPNTTAEQNRLSSCDTFIWEKEYPAFNGRAADNYTDMVMFIVSRSKPEEASWKRFFTSPIYSYFDDKYITGTEIFPLQALCLDKDHFIASYFRYWHGYQIILRPLLSLTDYNGIRQINKYLQPFLFALLIYLFCKRKAYGLILGWILSYLIFSPDGMPYNMTYSIVYYISVISSILLLTYKEKIEQQIGWPTFFMMIGIATNFFDFLTYPIVSLAVPLTILVYLNPPKNSKDMIKNLIIIVGCWILGYAGMWLLRWILCYFIIEENIVENVIKAIIDRAKAHIFEKQLPFWLAITDTFKQMCIHPDMMFFIVLICFISIIAVLYKMKLCIKFAKRNYYQLLSFIIVAMGIFAYCLIVQGHPLQHKHYTYRIWVTFFFPIISMMNFWVLEACKKTKKQKNKKNKSYDNKLFIEKKSFH